MIIVRFCYEESLDDGVDSGISLKAEALATDVFIRVRDVEQVRDGLTEWLQCCCVLSLF